MAAGDNRRIFSSGFRATATPSRLRAKPNDYLSLIVPTYIPWLGWTDVTKYTPITVYTSPLSIALAVGVTLYGDNKGSDIYRGAQFVYGDNIYSLAAGVISSITHI